MLSTMRDQRLRCAICEDVIGVYEPFMVLDGSQLRQTSWLNEPDLGTDQIVMHHHCALTNQHTEPDS